MKKKTVIEQYKDDNTPKSIWIAGELHGVPLAQGWRRGFDAAIALQLPVKFAEWRNWLYDDSLKAKKLLVKIIKALPKGSGMKELYQYWIDNIFKI